MLLLLMFGEDTRDCLQQNKTFAFSCVCSNDNDFFL